MTNCPHRPVALRALVAAVALLVVAQFAIQVRNGGILEGASTQASANQFFANAFPTAEAGVVAR